MIQIDIEMPKCCRECFALGDKIFYGRCQIKDILFGKNDQQWMQEIRPNWCPLIDEKEVVSNGNTV